MTLQPTIIYIDDAMVVINKPSGMIVNRADTTTGEITVQDWSEEYLHLSTNTASLEKLLPNGDYNSVYEFFSRGGIVHRLDKETSGILLIAKNPDIFAALKTQFMERTVQKTYIALSHGKITPETGEINVPMGRLEFNRKRFGVVAGGRESVTMYKTLALYEQTYHKQKEILTLVELHPKTGRTHQIRVHLKHINHPIFADFLYAGRKTARDDRNELSRVFLHAAQITLLHPVTKNEVTFTAPLSQDLESFLQTLQKLS